LPDQSLGDPDDAAQVASTLLRTGFHAASDNVGDTLVLRLQGELDMATAPGLGRDLDATLDTMPSVLVLDVEDLSFVDSTGLRVLITACRRAGSQGCTFVMRSPSRSVLKTLQLTGVDRLMVIEPAGG
jgi:anti-sigma B factor antagonist